MKVEDSKTVMRYLKLLRDDIKCHLNKPSEGTVDRTKQFMDKLDITIKALEKEVKKNG